jgi:peptidoglycan hydrolase CwlO-like protein
MIGGKTLWVLTSLVILVIIASFFIGKKYPDKKIVDALVQSNIENITEMKDNEIRSLNNQISTLKKQESKYKKDYEDIVVKLIKKAQQIKDTKEPKDLKEAKERYEIKGFTPNIRTFK